MKYILENAGNEDLCPNLTSSKISAQDTLHSTVLPEDVNKFCTLMLLSNLREPDWISIPCQEDLLAFIVCRKENTIKSKYNISKYKPSLYLCKSHHILVNNKCYSFIRNEFQTMVGQVCNGFKARGISMNEFTSLYHIFDAVSSINVFPTFIILHKQNIHVIHIYKLFNKVKFTVSQPTNSTVTGYSICNFNRIRIFTGTNIFECTEGGYILYKSVCDGIIDCPVDRSDEEFCICDENKFVTNRDKLCMKTKTKRSPLVCTFNYYMEINGLCKKYEFNMLTYNIQTQSLRKSHSLMSFFCHSGQPLALSLVNDLVSDCGSQFEDEPVLLALMNNNQTFLCKPQEIPCMEGHSKCFNITDICLFKLNAHRYIIPCRNDGHLENCEKFECNMIFKCFDSYCIPWMYVCDGKWDCPNGDDEQSYYTCVNKQKCQEMFKCRGEQYSCISIGQVCDSKLDCIHHDDEMFCELKFIECPNVCNCLIFSITCIRLDFINLKFNVFYQHLSVYISESNLSSLNILDYKLQHVHILHLPKNNFNLICPFLFLRSLLLVDLEFNFIREIKEKCFSASNLLKQISINNNHISYLHMYTFHNLHYLIFLNLSSNPFIHLPSKCFSNLFSLKSLNVENSYFETIHPNAFIYTYVKLIKTMDYKIACVIQNQAYCTSYPPWYVSCFDIIPYIFLKNIYISVSILVIGLNILSIFAQIF